MKDSVKLAATIFHRITGEEYKIEGFYYKNPRGFLVELSAREASNVRYDVLVDFGDERYDTWENVKSNLYMSEEEHKAMTRYVGRTIPYGHDPTVIMFDKQGNEYREKDFVPSSH